MRIIGHRGARGETPENTLGGFEYIQNIGIRQPNKHNKSIIYPSKYLRLCRLQVLHHQFRIIGN